MHGECIEKASVEEVVLYSRSSQFHVYLHTRVAAQMFLKGFLFCG